jgi:HPt (histidine-containing phosphotransfer) domain-containing protein
MSDSIDRPHLEQLGARFGAAFLVQLIDLFIVQGGERIAAAEAAAQAGDGRGVSAAAHALKSSAGNLGARSLSAQAADVERAGAEEGATPSLAALVSALGASFDEACTALRLVRAGYVDSEPR